YKLGPHQPHVEGKVQLIGGSTSEVRFVLFLEGKPDELVDIKWSASIPRADSKNWISFDTALQTLVLDPVSKR
ncbi:MAG: hypothetical protein AAFY56_17395, partial [Pseudomonadota bacterium]